MLLNEHIDQHLHEAPVFHCKNQIAIRHFVRASHFRLDQLCQLCILQWMR